MIVDEVQNLCERASSAGTELVVEVLEGAHVRPCRFDRIQKREEQRPFTPWEEPRATPRCTPAILKNRLRRLPAWFHPPSLIRAGGCLQREPQTAGRLPGRPRGKDHSHRRRCG